MSSFLVLVVDLESLLAGIKTHNKSSHHTTSSSSSSVQHDHKCNLDYIANTLAAYCVSFGLMQRNNRLVVLAFHSYGIDIVLPDPDFMTSSAASAGLDFLISLPDIHQKMKLGLSNITNSYIAELNRSGVASVGNFSRLSAALSNALTIINRIKQNESMDCRILVLQFDHDIPQNYNSVMNCIFSACKMEVMIDALVSHDSHLMQQACFLSGGIYKKLPSMTDLLIVLQTHFLSDRATRQSLALPTQETVNFKASCYCCKKPRDFTYMCSVCLTLVCTIPDSACIVCGTPIRPK